MAARRIAGLIKLHSPLGLCSKCIAKKSALSTATVIRVVQKLELAQGYSRVRAACSWCGTEKLCTSDIPTAEPAAY